MRKFNMNTSILINFYRCTMESLPTVCITVWYGSCARHRWKTLQRVVETNQHITENSFGTFGKFTTNVCGRQTAASLIIASQHTELSSCYHLIDVTGVCLHTPKD